MLWQQKLPQRPHNSIWQRWRTSLYRAAFLSAVETYPHSNSPVKFR